MSVAGDTNLQCRLAFEQTSNLGYDSSLNGTNTGTLVGGVTSGSDSTRGNYAAFNGTTGYINVNTRFSLPTTISLCAWVKLNATPSQTAIVISVGDGIFISARTTRKLRGSFQHPTLGTQFVETATTLSTGVWYHVAFVHTGTQQIIYLNGAQSGIVFFDTSISWNFAFHSNITRIGAFSSDPSGLYFNGQIDDVRVYDRVLGAGEVNSIYSYAVAATNQNAAETYTEDTPLNLTDIVVSASSVSLVTATLTLSTSAAGSLSTATAGLITSTFNSGTGVWQAFGNVTDVNTLLAGVVFTPAANYNSNFTIAVNIADNESVSALTGSKAITGTAVNDAPTATNLSAAETYTEDTPLNLIDIVISDIDSASVTATLTLSDTAAGSLSTGTSGAVTSTFSSGVWTASGAIANVNALLAAVTFTPAANYNSNFTIATSVSDGIAAPITGTKNMTGVAVDDSPAATNLNEPQTYNEAVPLLLTPIVVTDADSANVTVTLTLEDPSIGSISTGTSGSVTSSYNSGTGVWTASGAIDDVNALLSELYFTSNAGVFRDFDLATHVSDDTTFTSGVKIMSGIAAPPPPPSGGREICFAAGTQISLFNCRRKTFPVEELQPGMRLKSHLHAQGFVTVKRVLTCKSRYLVMLPARLLSEHQKRNLVSSRFHLLRSRHGWAEASFFEGALQIPLDQPTSLYNVEVEEGWSSIVAEGVECETCAVSQEDKLKRARFAEKRSAPTNSKE